MTPGLVAALLFSTFIFFIILRVPVAFALALACLPVFYIEPRLTPVLLLQEMFRSYNSFILLAVPFFLLATRAERMPMAAKRALLMSATGSAGTNASPAGEPIRLSSPESAA